MSSTFLLERGFLLFIIGSFSTWLFETLLTIVLTEFGAVPSRISYGISLSIGLVLLYLYQRKIIFSYTKGVTKSVSKFLTVYILSYVINWILVALLTTAMHYVLSIIIVSAVLFPLNYLFTKHWAFEKRWKA